MIRQRNLQNNDSGLLSSDPESRRQFFQHSAAAIGLFPLTGAFESFLARSAEAGARSSSPGYGKLIPIPDENTGLKLLQLPKGFRYISYGWRHDRMTDGTKTPASHDGMAVIAQRDDQLVLCRNHELSGHGKPFGSSEITYDPQGPGGCVNLVFDTKQGCWLKSWPSMSGTSRNCAGGPTPWGSWLTCEETVFGPGDVDEGKRYDFQRSHGWIFEVSAEKTSLPVPLKDMGRFVHEAVCVDPKTKIVYETEDQDTAGFYRFLPNEPGKLVKGGRLQMMKVAGRADVRRRCKLGQTFDTTWVDIEDPTRRHSPGTTDELGVYKQGKRQGATTFARLEGCWFGNGLCQIVSTSGGDAEKGQVWEYDPRNERLRLVFESPHKKILDKPDNITVSPRGGIVLCEDGDFIPQRLQGLTPDGRIFPLAANNVILKGEINGFRGDFRDQEWAGVCFSPDGEWLFANIQTPGVTFAITGPWKEGAL